MYSFAECRSEILLCKFRSLQLIYNIDINGNSKKDIMLENIFHAKSIHFSSLGYGIAELLKACVLLCFYFYSSENFRSCRLYSCITEDNDSENTQISMTLS